MDVVTNRAFDRLSTAVRPYAPGWFDRLTDGVRRLPIPFPVFYLVIGLVLSLGRTVIGWTDGSYPVGTFFPVHVLDGLNPVYLFFAIHFLDNVAYRAISEFRPRFSGGDTTYDQLRYRLTTMPAIPSLIVGILGFGLGAIYMPVFLSPVDLELSKYFSSPPAIPVDIVLSGLSGLAMVMFGYHSLRQLRIVSVIYTRHTKVNIFDVGPLHALSRVAAMTAVALLIFSYVYIAFYANWQIYSVSNAIVLGLLLLVAVLTFIVPLYGSHRLLKHAKVQRLSEIGRSIESAANGLHERADEGVYSDEVAQINNALDGLLKERAMVAKAPTWPWDPDTVRAVITALLLPIFLWLITRILERVGI